MRSARTHTAPLSPKAPCLKTEHSIPIVGITMLARSAAFALSGELGRLPRRLETTGKLPRSANFLWLFHQLMVLKDFGCGQPVLLLLVLCRGTEMVISVIYVTLLLCCIK